MKITPWLLLLVPVAASAQITYDYDYTSGPLTAVSSNTPMLPLPSLGSDITGIITLSQELPESGTVTVNPVTTQFIIGNVYATSGVAPAPYVSTYTFTTQNGMLTSFSFDQTDPIERIHADTASNEVTFNLQYPFAPTLQLTVSGTAGSFTGPGLNAAPEIDSEGAIPGLTLLIGMLLMMQRRRTVR